MDTISLIGTIAATLTTTSFMPQAAKVIKTRHTHDISLGMYFLMTIGVAVWLVYGIMLEQWPIIISNAIGLIPTSIILFMKLREK